MRKKILDNKPIENELLNKIKLNKRNNLKTKPNKVDNKIDNNEKILEIENEIFSNFNKKKEEIKQKKIFKIKNIYDQNFSKIKNFKHWYEYDNFIKIYGNEIIDCIKEEENIEIDKLSKENLNLKNSYKNLDFEYKNIKEQNNNLKCGIEAKTNLIDELNNQLRMVKIYNRMRNVSA